MIGVVMEKGVQLWFAFFFCLMTSYWIEGPTTTYAVCLPKNGCSVALAYYNVSSSNDTLSSIASLFQTSVSRIQEYNDIQDSNVITLGQKLLIPFQCACGGDQLGHNFTYIVKHGDDVQHIANDEYDFLSTFDWIQAANPSVTITDIFANNTLLIPVNCSCGNPNIDKRYGLFVTYVVEDGDSLSSVSQKFNFSSNLLAEYNNDVNVNVLRPSLDILFIPHKDGNGIYPPYNDSSKGTKATAIVGASVGGAVALLIVVGIGLFCFCVYLPRKHRKLNNVEKQQTPLVSNQTSPEFTGQSITYSQETTFSNLSTASLSSGLNLAVDKSVEFSYEELAMATDNFSIAKKIGEGGYGAVYLGVVRGQKLAIKMMNLTATKEFLAELKVLTRVHHTNLVRLIGYCTVDSLFLVYEYVENGTLSQHLRFSGREGHSPLTWAARVQIALDAARGLEYIHEHTTPTYIHRDIKPSNILLDKNFHAKVADFGLTRLTESGAISRTLPSRLVGTFGYMAPEYARYGDVSPKADVFSFGVVLLEIISAKEAIVQSTNTDSASPLKKGNLKGLVTLFDNVLNDPNGKDKLHRLIDPALGDNYPLESVWKMALLAGACTREDPLLRPTMRVAVVTLMTLSSATQEWELSSNSGEHAMENLLSGR